MGSLSERSKSVRSIGEIKKILYRVENAIESLDSQRENLRIVSTEILDIIDRERKANVEFEAG